MPRWLKVVAVFFALLKCNAAEVFITTLDGFGHPVDWFVVIKLPRGSFSSDQINQLNLQGFSDADLTISKAHCTCADPLCTSSANATVGIGRGSGLCYLYADANNSTLRYFSDIIDPRSGARMECLGQGGNDPVSHTLQQLYRDGRYGADDIEWAFWNDQYQGTADAQYGKVCGFSSYSEEAFPYKSCASDADCGKRCGKSASGYANCTSDIDCVLSDSCRQISCSSRMLPHYNAGCSSPYGHAKGALAYARNKSGFLLQATTPNYPDPSGGGQFVKLGCQLDGGNVQFANSFFGMTLKSTQFAAVAPILKAARLCSTNTGSCLSGKAGHIIGFNCTSEHTRGQSWSILPIAFAGASTSSTASAYVNLTTPGGVRLTLIAKSEADVVPPWLLVAHTLGCDLAVASWLDPFYGSASLCKGDNFTAATNQGCLNGTSLGLVLDDTTGGPAHSVENALTASFTINGSSRSWGLWGDLKSDITSHAKYAVQAAAAGSGIFVSGDMNQQGWHCSHTCTGSQDGRGGLFVALADSALHASAHASLTLVCACDSNSASYDRFCGFGCGWEWAEQSVWAPMNPDPVQNMSHWVDANKAWTGPTCASGSDPVYDHQNVSYNATRTPGHATASSRAPIILTPFFSPDSSAASLVALIDEASISVDIMTPSASTWSTSCDQFYVGECNPGCSPIEMRADPFPIFGALLNALHRGVTIRILTNDFEVPDCGNKALTMLPFLAFNGADIRFYTTTAFIHAKYIQADSGSISRTKTAISSVNWSKTSVTQNREAGAILSGIGSAPLAAKSREVFESDWAQAYALNLSEINYGFTDVEVESIINKSTVSVTIPDSPHHNGNGSSEGICFDSSNYVSTANGVTLRPGTNVTLVGNPDGAYEQFTEHFARAKTTLEIYMYQITGELCENVAKVAARGVNVSLLVSASIYDSCDCEAARTCLPMLVAAGVHTRLTPPGCFPFAHQKYFVADYNVEAAVSLGWSTGNLSPSDYRKQTTYPLFGDSGWVKQNRDFTVWVDGDSAAASLFRTVLWRDWFSNGAKDWSVNTRIKCTN